MKWDWATAVLLTVAIAGLAIAFYDATSSPSAATGGAAMAAASGLVLLLRATWEESPQPVRPRLEPPSAPVLPAGGRLDRDAFARRQVYDTVAALSTRVLGPDRWRPASGDAERICSAPAAEFRGWVAARLQELEAET